MATTITAGNSTNGAAISSDNTGILELKSGTGSGTTAITADASQNVGIGTSSPLGRLHTSETNGINYFESPGVSSIALQFRTNSVNRYRVGIPSASNDLAFYAGGTTETMRLDSSGNFQFNSGYGSVATAYGCRAWVNFNGTGTVAIRASGNVSSITDIGTGQYVVNLTTAMPDANYSVPSSANNGSTFSNTAEPISQATNNFNIVCYSRGTSSTGASAVSDMPTVVAAVFR